ncbi:MAG: T9SS type A sorting domain-containing protein [Candidatus Kapaibacterium sp.]
MKKNSRLFFAFFSLLFVSSGAKAQTAWHHIHTDFDGRYDYCFEVISCFGNNCTIGGDLVDEKLQRITRVFWRSTDGGNSWKIQDPGLRVDTNFLYRNNFTKIQQIDSLNIVAVGLSWDPDSGGLGDIPLILRTFDGGKTWEKQNLGQAGVVRDIHFSDLATGIALVQDNYDPGVGMGPVYIYTTMNAGKNWALVPLIEFNINLPIGIKFAQCYSAASGDSNPGKFRVFKSWYGAVYITNDNWQTQVIADPISNPVSDPNGNYHLFNCNFIGVDTIIAYGFYGQFNSTQEGMMIRSTDGGASWGAPIRFPGTVSSISGMTSLGRDTVLAWGNSANIIFLSTDRGTTWRTDSLVIDTAYAGSTPLGMDFCGGHPIAIYGIGMTAPSILIRADGLKSQVRLNSGMIGDCTLFPNPASTTATINFGFDSPGNVTLAIFDLLGRRVKEISLGELNAGEHSETLDLQSLPNGSYLCRVTEGGKVSSVAFTVVK